MDITGAIALITALVTAVAAMAKNRSQDAIVAQLKTELGQMRHEIAECERERSRLWAFLASRLVIADDSGEKK